MDNKTELESDPRPEIPEPDLDNLDPWLEKVVNKPAVSYETGANADGTPLTPDQQLKLTREQIKTFVSGHKEMSENPRFKTRALTGPALKQAVVDNVRTSGVSTKFK